MNNVKKSIGWADYTINPIKGLCKQGCWYCYARRMYKRFHWKEEVILRLDELDKIKTIKEPSRIFLCSTHDLFGEWIPDKWIFDIITKLQNYSQHTFLLLTKNPNKYANYCFRKNFWLGQTITGKGVLNYIKNSGINFVSFEPLLEEINYPLDFVNWVIIGALTGKGAYKIPPKEYWIIKILYEADKCKIPVFMKNNLKPYWQGKLRQEFPS